MPWGRTRIILMYCNVASCVALPRDHDNPIFPVIQALRLGKPTPARHLSAKERSWDGGPGFNVALARDTLRQLLVDEQWRGVPYTAAAVGDGSWDKQTRRTTRTISACDQ